MLNFAVHEIMNDETPFIVQRSAHYIITGRLDYASIIVLYKGFNFSSHATIVKHNRSIFLWDFA